MFMMFSLWEQGRAGLPLRLDFESSVHPPSSLTQSKPDIAG